MNQLNPKMIQEVASYVISLQGTNPPGGKPPEGNKYEEIVSDSLKASQDSAGVSADSIKKNDVRDESVIKDSVKLK